MSTTTNLHPPSSLAPPQTPLAPTTRHMVLWIHDPDGSPTLSKHEAVLNYDLFPAHVAKPGDIAEVRLLSPPTGNASDESVVLGGENMERKKSYTNSVIEEEGAGINGRIGATVGRVEKKFLFVIRELEPEQRGKPNLQISLARHVADLFGFPSRATVIVTIVDKSIHEATHVEIYFRDQYISRDDMWRMATTLLSDTCPFNSQKPLFIASIRGTIGNIWVRGQKVQSAYFSSRTVPIFRSESARYVLFVQMSREMWHFDTDDGGDGDQGEGGGGGVGGEIVFNKLINGFLPELFKRWKRINAHHLVSIVLFTRVVYEHGEPVGILNGNGKESEEFLGTPGGINIGEGRRYRDFYRVVVSSMASADWTIILHRLKKEFSVFLRDILVLPIADDDLPSGSDQTTPMSSEAASTASRPGTPSIPSFAEMLRTASSTSPQPSPRVPQHKSNPNANAPRKNHAKMIITGRPSAAINGNILEAINLATLQFSKDYIDRDLVRTGISVVVITPGTGHFEVDYDMLKATTEGLIMSGMGVDLVCLSKVPLHTVPLFKYRSPVPTSVLMKQEAADGHLPPGLSPPKFNITPSSNMAPDPGEWVYAVPHWIDISFWSAASEKKLNNRGRVEKKRDKKKPSGAFRARAKMHELQMMGIMENEISEISVPLLHDNPFWKPMPTGEDPAPPDGGPGKGNGAAGAVAGTMTPSKPPKEAFRWMDEYDDALFCPLRVLEEREKAALACRIDGGDPRKIQKTLEEVDPLLGTSFHGEAPGRQVSIPGGAFFDRKMKERRPELESPIESRDDNPNVNIGGATSVATAPTGGLLRQPSRLVRGISIGFKSWGAAKATAKTGLANAETTAVSAISSSSASGSGVMVTRGFDTGEDLTPKSPLSARAVNQEESPMVGSGGIRRSPEKPGWGSRPISIKNNAISSLEAAARERDRRRAIVGSPLDGRASAIRERGGESVDILKAASLTRHGRPGLDLVANAEKTATIPPTVSPTSALSPWVQVLNPSNPKKSGLTAVNQFRLWHHVFPKPVKTSTVKWKSLCTPAALPLTTEHFPTAEQLRDEYQENPYVISQNADYDELEGSGNSNREELVRAMISQRLSQGFQIVVGSAVAEATAGRGGDSNVYSKNYMVRAGSSCFMSLGSQIHQLICDEEYNVEVKRYVRKPTTAISSSAFTVAGEYISYIKTVMSDDYTAVKASFRLPIAEYNWNYVDQYIGGYEDTLTEQLRYWRARFVLIPNDPPESARGGGLLGRASSGELNDEEIRLEGIRRLTQIFQRNRYVPPVERQYERYGRQRGKEKNPLQILYKTVDPSVVVAQELESPLLIDDPPPGNMRRSQLLTTETFEKKNLDLKAISQELQGPKGVRLQDRRWHLRLHSNCFIGEEMVTWIIENFKDVETRQEAEEVGLKLFKAGLFQHVDKRLEFRDGNYFYRIAEAHANPPRPSSKGGWFGTFKGDRSVPPTPSFDATASPLRSRSSTIVADEGSETCSSPTSGCRTPTPGSSTRRRVEKELSKVMKYDVDPTGKSYRKELINLHYDLLHNPDNCYHIRIDWMNATAKLIEDQLASWARTLDRYGLKLVEAPIDEVSTIPTTNPFRGPYIFKFCIPPPPLPTTLSESMDPSPILSSHHPHHHHHHHHHHTTNNSHYYYHRLALRKLSFVLDTEASSNFPQAASVKYSWGKPTYTYSQYIHRSGLMFCQITHDGSFLLMTNRQYNVRTAMLHPPPTLTSSSSSSGGGGGEVTTPESVKSEVEAFCKDPEVLRRFYDEVGGGRGGGGGGGIASHGSPVMGVGVVHGGGRTTSMKSGRSSIVDLANEDFALGRSGYEFVGGPGR